MHREQGTDRGLLQTPEKAVAWRLAPSICEARMKALRMFSWRTEPSWKVPSTSEI